MSNNIGGLSRSQARRGTWGSGLTGRKEECMINALVRRTIPRDKDQEVLTIIARLRARAAHARGYISSEIVWNLEKELEYVSMTKWQNLESWKAWLESEPHRELQSKLDDLGCVTSYELFGYPEEHALYYYEETKGV